MNELMKYVNKQKSVHSECFIQARSVSCRKGKDIINNVQHFMVKTTANSTTAFGHPHLCFSNNLNNMDKIFLMHPRPCFSVGDLCELDGFSASASLLFKQLEQR